MTETRKIKVLFAVPTLAGGGAEKMLIALLRALDRGRFSLALALHNRQGPYAEDIPADVEVFDLAKAGPADVIRIILTLSGKIFPRVRPDVVVSFIEYSNLVVLAAAGLSRVSPAVIVSERTHPSRYHRQGRGGRVKRLLLKRLYPRADGIIAISRGIREELARDFRVPREKIKVIHNCFDPDEIERLRREDPPGADWLGEGIPTVIACGSFKRAKNYPLLIKAFARSAASVPSRLVILGDGPERDALERLVAGLGLEEKVIFLGFRKNPYPYLSRADVFVLSSSWEGFGNVMIEAMACGTPVIATRCPSGPGEIITDGRDGLLVPPGDEAALAAAITGLLRDGDRRRRLARAGRKRSEDFHLERMVRAYEEAIEGAAGGVRR